MKTILITGAWGNLGQHLVKYFQDNYPDFKLIGTGHMKFDFGNIIFNSDKIIVKRLDLIDSHKLNSFIDLYKPDYMINCAGFSKPNESWDEPVGCYALNTLCVIHQLEAIRKFHPSCRYLNCGSAEETKTINFNPYGSSKSSARQIIKLYNKKYGIQATQVWLGNCESILRSEKYLSKKIAKGVARIAKSIEREQIIEPMRLGNIDGFINFSHCSDISDGIWKVLNQDLYKIHSKEYFDAYTLANKEEYKIHYLIEKAFEVLNIKIVKADNGDAAPVKNSRGCQIRYTLENGTPVIVIDADLYFKQYDDNYIITRDSNRAMNDLGWKPKVSFQQIVEELVKYEYNESCTS